MRAPIAQRPVTGARRIPRRRRPRAGRASLRRPLALLYRQSGAARTAAPAAVRAADGGAVPLAPRLQVALHLSFAFNDQRLEFPVSAAPSGAAPAMPAATASPADRPEGKASTSRRLIFAAYLRRLETVCRRLREAPIGSRLLFPDAGPRANAVPASAPQGLLHTRSVDRRIAILSGGGTRGQEGSAHPTARASGSQSLVYTRSIDHLIALLSGDSGGQRSTHPGAQGVTPPWPLREEAAATWAAHVPAPLPGRGNDSFTRLIGRPGAAAAGTSRGPLGAVRQGAGGRAVDRERLVLAQPAPDATADRASPAAPPLLVQPLSPSGTGVGRLVRETLVTPPGTSVPRASPRSPPAMRAAAERRLPRRERLTLAQPTPPDARYATADPASPAAPAGRPPRGSGIPFSRLARPRPPGGAGIERFFREKRVTLPGASVSSAIGAVAARAGTAPLYLAERVGGRTLAPGPFDSVWAPPPLDFRSAAPPPAPPPPEEARPAATMAPSAAPIDLEAVSRGVIARIEKRLRVERERRGRS